MIRIKPILSAFLICLCAFTANASPEKKEIKFLSGTDNENTVQWDFFCTSGRKSGYWTTINVPSHWEQQGFGEYDYGRDYRTYGKKFNFADESGMYRHQFEVPTEWKNKRIYIVFEGSMTDTEVKINDKLAGNIHQGAFYRFKYDITDKIKFGDENKLEVKVDKVSANASVNRAERYADYWVFGGIYRPVYLEVVPTEFVERVAINADAKGNFNVEVFPHLATQGLEIEAQIINAEQQVVATMKKKVSTKDSIVSLNTTVKDAKLWTSETPNMYCVRINLKDGENIKYTLNEKFGFRTIEIRQGDGVYVNGSQVKFKGINRHAFWPESGRCLNPSIDLADVKLLKEMNMNAVRCSHYPPDKTFLNYCDSLGLYVLNELAGWQNSYDTPAGEKLVKEMVIRDVNHPSIVFWSNGNEGGTNKELDDDFAIYDLSKRPVIHAHHKPGNDFNGIDCNHYENYFSSKDILNSGLIYMPTEFLHGQDDGGMAAGLSDFWDLFWNSKHSAGGFLWVLADEGIVRTDFNNTIDVNRVNAPDGAVGPHREKEPSVYAMREIFSPIKIELNKLPQTAAIVIPLENRYHFTNLKDCSFSWQLVDFSTPRERSTFHTVKKEGKLISPDIAPAMKGNITLNLPSDYKQYDALYLKAKDPHGEEILCWSWKIEGNKNTVLQLVEKELSDSEKEHLSKLKSEGIEEDNILPINQQKGNNQLNAKVEINETDSTISLESSGIGVTFCKKNGTIKSLQNAFGLALPFTNGPVLVSGSANVISIKNHAIDGGHVIKMTYAGDLKSVVWTMYNGGWLQLDYEYMVEGKQPFIGISFDFPESDIISAKWLGKGDNHVWKNRPQSGVLDVYQRMYNNVLPADNNWQQAQFKGYFPDVSWMEFNTVYGKFTMVAQEEDLFVRLFDFYGISGPINYPELPTGNISFLDGIPAIGTKLAMGISNNTASLGKMGEANEMTKPVKRTLFFYFGLLN
ncbi:MAG: glycoside hydrolase family 2 TIM barrel-domain containing protein [Mangrovibacterium sp.]